MSALLTTSANPSTVKVGDKIQFTPRGSGQRWWLVRARDERWIIATQQVPFKPKGTLQYTVVDLTGWTHYCNGVQPGPARSSINVTGGGWGDGTYSDADIADMLSALQDPDQPWELSTRRVVAVWAIEVKE